MGAAVSTCLANRMSQGTLTLIAPGWRGQGRGGGRLSLGRLLQTAPEAGACTGRPWVTPFICSYILDRFQFQVRILIGIGVTTSGGQSVLPRRGLGLSPRLLPRHPLWTAQQGELLLPRASGLPGDAAWDLFLLWKYTL